jgi:cation diffusion facilitator CzcD-associated flavoprotein CzcO
MAFQGKLMHTARYDDSIDLTGKRVAVIGAGSSGVQCIAAVQKQVSKLYTWVRSPIWITAGFAQKFAGKDGANFNYTDRQKQWLQDNPDKYLEYRKIIESELNQRFKFIIKGTDAAKEARAYSEDEMIRKLSQDPRLIDKVIPKDFNVGCRRPTPGNGFLEALTANNTTCFTDPIDKITPRASSIAMATNMKSMSSSARRASIHHGTYLTISFLSLRLALRPIIDFG